MEPSMVIINFIV